MKRAIELNVNGDTHEVLVSPNNTLLEVLRDKLGLMGTKRGCDLGAKDKMQPFMEILEKLGLEPSEVAYVGDDLVDLPVMRMVGFSVTVADASDDIKPYVDLVTSRPGGRGAVREVCDFLLKQSSLWTSVTSRYFED